MKDKYTGPIKEVKKPIVLAKPEPEKIEDELRFLGRFAHSIVSGTKRVSLRLGKRKFAKNIKVNGLWAIVENQYSRPLRYIPFSIFHAEGWTNLHQVLFNLGTVYPGINLNTVFTVVEFRLEIPHREVK